MPIDYEIDSQLGTTFVSWRGLVGRDEFVVHVRRLLADPAWPPRHARHLCDLRSATLDQSIDAAVLAEAAALYGTHPKIATLRVAIVAGEAFEHAVIFERFLSQYRAATIAFNTLETACTWLGMDPEHAADALSGLAR